jgi:hypothetical protein
MYCFLLQTSMFQLSSALTIGLHTNPTNPTNVSMDPLEASEVDCVPRYILEHILSKLTSKKKPKQNKTKTKTKSLQTSG